jgi:hypothetical protein
MIWERRRVTLTQDELLADRFTERPSERMQRIRSKRIDSETERTIRHALEIAK